MLLDEILFEIGKLKWTVVINVIVAFVFCVFFVLSTKKFKWKKKTLINFAYLYNLTASDAVCVGLLMGRLAFVLSSVIFCNNINLGYFVIFILFNIMVFITSKSFKLLINGMLVYSVVFFLLYMQNRLGYFYTTIDNNWVVIVMCVNLGIFNFLTVVQNTIYVYESITKKRYVND